MDLSASEQMCNYSSVRVHEDSRLISRVIVELMFKLLNTYNLMNVLCDFFGTDWIVPTVLGKQDLNG